MKESFFEASVRVDEEFESAEEAHLSNKPSDKASVKVLDIKLEMSRIKNKLKEQDVRSQSDKGTQGSAIGGIKKDV